MENTLKRKKTITPTHPHKETAPCLDCTNRCLGCHSICTAYEHYKSITAKPNKKAEQDLIDYCLTRYRKGRR